MSDSYIHGTHRKEQDRLTLLNRILNDQCIRALMLKGNERVLDVGSGLGQFTRLMATRLESGEVVGVERDPVQIEAAMKLAGNDPGPFSFREGDAYSLPLTDDEWGTFDVVHCRFVLEHLRKPSRAVGQMFQACRPGGRIVLIDDDHTLFRLDPTLNSWDNLWEAYQAAFFHNGTNPNIGRELVSLLGNAGCREIGQGFLQFGSWRGSPDFHDYVDNIVGILKGARATMMKYQVIDPVVFDTSITALRRWARRKNATIWYPLNRAEGIRPQN